MGFLRGRQKRARRGRSGGGFPPRRIGRLGAAGVRAPWPALLMPPGVSVAVAPAIVLITVGDSLGISLPCPSSGNARLPPIVYF